MLNKNTIRTNEQLKEAGFSQEDIKAFRRSESNYYLLLVDLDEANAKKNWDDVLELEPKIANLEFLLKYQGVNPKEIPVSELRTQFNDNQHDDTVKKASYKRIRNHGTGIRAYCISCMNGQPSEVRACEATHCILWPFRLGGSPFFGKTLKPVTEIEVEGDERVAVEEDSDEGRNELET